MSLAQRRTTLDGIEAISPEDVAILQGDHQSLSPHTLTINRDRRVSVASVVESTIPEEDNKEVWQALSYDAFAQPPNDPIGAELQHYESFPAEITENLAAYEVSTVKRIGVC